MSSLTSAVRAVARPRLLASRLAPLAVIAVAVTALLPTMDAAAASAAPPMGTAGSFAVLAYSGITVTTTGTTTITGDTGSNPTPAETGWGSVVQVGTNHPTADGVTLQAKNDLSTAYTTAANDPTTVLLTNPELGGLTLLPGVYTAPAGGLQITGTLTLNTLGNPAAVFIFQSANGLTTAANSNVVELNGGLACNVFWQIAPSATFGTGAHLIGTVMASTSITATTGATFVGRLLAETGAVTLDTNTITNQGCPIVPPPVVPPAGTPTTATPATTKAPTPTTKAPTTTTKAPTTTTKAPTTTAVPKKVVLLPAAATPTTSGPTPLPGTPTPTPGTPTPTPGTPTPPVPGTPPLPFTGFSIGWPLLVGGVTLAFGVSVLALSHRRDRRLNA